MKSEMAENDNQDKTSLSLQIANAVPETAGSNSNTSALNSNDSLAIKDFENEEGANTIDQGSVSVGTDDNSCSSENKVFKNAKNGRGVKKRVKEYRSLEHIQKELSKASNENEKLSIVTQRYGELYNEFHSLHNSYKGSEKKLIAIQKEKESFQTDYSKAILARSRLEDLCRELQRQNRVVKEESLLRVREEEEKRKEASGKFQTALNDISVMLQDNQTQSTKLQEENMEMAKKLKVLFDQYQLREKHVNKLIEHGEIKSKVSDTKIAKLQATYAEDKEHGMREKKQLLEELMVLQKKCTELATSELKARSELRIYKEKYEEFQENLKKSNMVFDNFKSEMNKMSKKIGKLEKETVDWQGRWTSSNKALITMAEDKQKSEQLLLQSKQKIAKLENLCRALQQERNELSSSVKNFADVKPVECSSKAEEPHGESSHESSGAKDKGDEEHQPTESVD